MSRSSRVLLGLVGLIAGVASVALVRTSIHAREREGRFARGETPLGIFNPSGLPLRLLRSGATLDQASALSLEAGETWMAEDRYFLEARRADTIWTYPVPLLGTGGGPDAGGSFAIVVRAPGQPPDPDGRFVFIPAGHFLIGDRKNPLEAHFVWVTGFYLDSFEVTNGEFRRFLEDPRGYDERRHWTGEGWRWKEENACAATARLAPADPDYPRFGQDDQPVVLVTWHEARAFGRWKTAREGAERWLYRMPTEAEWEKAARGPDSFDYGLGQVLSEPEQHLYNWKKNPDAAETLVGWGETRRRFRPNRYGVYHGSGNVAEWTQSLFRPYSRQRPYEDDDRNQDTGSGMRTSRGGSWYSANTVRLHLAYREEFQPELRSNDLGFRIAAFPLP